MSENRKKNNRIESRTCENERMRVLEICRAQLRSESEIERVWALTLTGAKNDEKTSRELESNFYL
jgi:hypothetical protein